MLETRALSILVDSNPFSFPGEYGDEGCEVLLAPPGG